MHSKSENTIGLETGAVWAEETKVKISPHQNPQLKTFLTIALTVLVLAMVAAGWIYLNGLSSIRSNLPNGEIKPSDTAFLSTARIWALESGFTGILSSVVLILLSAFYLTKLQEHFHEQQRDAQAALDLKAQRMLGEMTDAKISAEEYQNELSATKKTLDELKSNFATIEKELHQKREAEKSLAKQTVQLERSKDVLEMHVHARTQQLHKMQRRHELILNSAVDGICSFDLQGKATFVNPALSRLTGWSVEELLGKTEEEIFHPDRNNSFREKLVLSKDAAGKLLSEQLLGRKDGTTFQAEYFKTTIEENKHPIGSVVMVKDITERRLAENRLNLKASELARSNKELEQFAFVASHDLQEPLRKIQAFGDRLKIKCGDALVKEGKDYLERMQNAAARMQTLINDLLTFSRVISSSQPFVELDLGVIVKEVLGDLEHRIEKTGATVQVGNLPKIHADGTQMRQLFQNIIGNALKFKAADVAPVIKVDAVIVKRSDVENLLLQVKPSPDAEPDDRFCRIEIKDNGIGFDEQYLEKIFAVFQRLHGRDAYEGTGVGLAVCRRITERHGGIITAKSKDGQGATFIILLPLEQTQPPSI